MFLRMHDRVISIHHHDKPVCIRIEMQMPYDRGQHLAHIRPAPSPQRRLHQLYWFTHYRFDQ
jgi:hypothetical protein